MQCLQKLREMQGIRPLPAWTAFYTCGKLSSVSIENRTWLPSQLCKCAMNFSTNILSEIFSPFFGRGGGPGGRFPPRVLPGGGGGAGGLPPLAGLLVRLDAADAERLVFPLSAGRGGGGGAGGTFLL